MNPNQPNQQYVPNPPAGGQAPSNGYPYPVPGQQPMPSTMIQPLQQMQQPQMMQPQIMQQPMRMNPNMPGINQNMNPAMMPPAPGLPQAVPIKSNPNSTQNTLQIAEIRDGIVIMNDGSYRSVIMVKSINFDLMSPQEREAVEFSYQGFLNSLYFPIQIFVRSQKVDLRPYIDKLDKIRTEHDNMLLALLMEDYIGFMTDLSYQTNIMDKKFYVVVPFFPVADAQKLATAGKGFMSGIIGNNNKERPIVINERELENAKTELKNRVQSVLSGLLQSNIQGLPLDTQELIELYYDVYNPDTATRQQLKNFNDLTAPIVTKGEGTAFQPHLEKELS